MKQVKRHLNLKLDAFMRRKALTCKGFATLVSNADGEHTVSGRTVENWLYSVSIPRGWALAAIFKATDGEVTPNDFVPLEGAN